MSDDREPWDGERVVAIVTDPKTGLRSLVVDCVEVAAVPLDDLDATLDRLGLTAEREGAR